MLLRDLSNNNGKSGLAAIGDPKTSAFYLKATEGTGFKDPYYAAYRAEIARRGKVSGAYLFLHHDEDGGAQVRTFLSFAKPRPGDLQPVVDVEMGSPSLSARVAYRALAALEADGFDPIMYTSTSWLGTLLKTEPRLGRFRVWQAEYGPVLHRIPGFRVIAWQFTDKLTVAKGPLRTDGSQLFVRDLRALEFRPKPAPRPTPAPSPSPAPAPAPKPAPAPRPKPRRKARWVVLDGLRVRVGSKQWKWLRKVGNRLRGK